MELNQYQEKAMTTCMKTSANPLYMLFMLGEEIGDCLWGIAGITSQMDWSLEDVAQMNLDKLAARKKAGTIDGSGDGIIREK